MTVVVVMVDPPRPGLALPDVADNTPLSATEAADLYAAMVKDTVIAVSNSGGDLLINYRPDELLAEQHRTETSPEAEVRALAADPLEDLEQARFEPQVGSDLSARAGNTITHLLREEDATSAAIVPGTAPLITRSTVDTAAVSLRRAPVVLGPANEGRVHYAGFTEPIDFAGALTAPVLPTLADHAADADHETAFIEFSPVVERGADLLTLLAMIQARRTAGKSLPAFTTALIERLDLIVVTEDGNSRIERA
jgi:glycosyltransferase A (GT-A) superfamily protein (DUF2064 family)